MMTSGNDNETLLIRYLLGQMQEEEQARIEERYFADPEFHAELRAAERELIDRYVLAELSGSEREQFEKSFLSIPLRKEKVEFARALVKKLGEADVMARAPVRETPSRPASLFFLTGHNLYWMSAAAASILLIGGWLLIGRRQDVGLPPQESPIARQPAPVEMPAKKEVEKPREPEVTPPQQAKSTPPPVRVATLVLVSSLVRGAQQVPTLALEGNVQPRLQLHFEAGDYKGYKAILQTVEGEEIWRQDGLQPRSPGSDPSIVVTPPLDRFRTRDYIVILSGIMADGESEDVASYYFRVKKQ